MNELNIIIPYRNRNLHLDIFIPYMKYFLQNKNYKITVVEQDNSNLFNRGKLFNIGFDLCKNNNAYYCFHDVDMLPVEVSYDYHETPLNLVSFATQFGNNRLPDEYYGGVSLFNNESFLNINGFSNDYLGWGAEDDDLLRRVLSKNYKIIKRNGVYLSLKHTHVGSQNNPNYKNNFNKLMNSYDYSKDGLSNLSYKINSKINLNDIVTLYKVDL